MWVLAMLALGILVFLGGTLWLAAGTVLMFAGLMLMAGSNLSLIKKGRGAAAFLLTERLVTEGLYARTRNPMSLGFYAACIGIGMIAGSHTVTLAVLLVLVLAHMLNVKLFEELCSDVDPRGRRVLRFPFA